MNPVKLNIKPRSPASFARRYQDGINVLFNPNSYSITKPVTWNRQTRDSGSTAATGSTPCAAGSQRELDAPPLVYGGGGSRTLTLQLFFDVTEGGPDADVREETNKIVALTRIQRAQGDDRSEPPVPVCEITWGKAPSAPEPSDFPFIGVVTNLQQNFVLFRSNGAPVRANLTVVFTEYNNAEQNKRQTDPDLTTYVIKRGDTLSAIAATLYRDASQWRLIAAANGIDDPRHLAIGKRLSIPEKR